MRKRGQVTLFIILGIFLVVSAVLLYSFREEIFLSQWERERVEALAVPEEAEELHQHMSACVEDVAADAVTLLGLQGGYVVLPEDPIGEGLHNPFSNSLEIFSGTDFQTAYWFYEAANGVAHTQIPSIETMETALAGYVNENLAACATDFDLFVEYNASAELVSTNVEILDDQVLFTVRYPVRIALEDFVFTFEAFYVAEDVPLGALYQAATEIMETENEQFVFEELSYDALVLYDEIPLSWTEFDCERKTWDVDDIEASLKEILAENIRAVKVRGADYTVSEESDENYFEWNLFESSVPEETSVNLLYSTQWPFSMQVYPAEGGTLVEDSLSTSPLTSFLSGLFCLTHYNFIYDIQYPVLVTLYDQASDYRFQFASMVILDNNQPRENREGLLDLSPVEDTICADVQMPLMVSVVEVMNDGTLQGLDDALVSFQCITSLCPLGSTSREGEASFLVPPCVNGEVIAEKDGYQRAEEIVTTLEESFVTVVLERYYNLSYSIEVVDAEGIVRTLGNDEIAFVTLTEEETGYSTTVTHPYQNEYVLLIPGTYHVQAQLVSEVPFDIQIDPSAYTTCTSVPQISLGGLFGFEDDASCVDVEISEVELQSALTGGVDRTWYVDRYVLQDASHITFYVTSPGVPEDIDELEELTAYVDAGFGYKEPVLE